MAIANDDDEHLRLLSLFHYIVAGIGALCALFPIIHLAIGLGLVTGAIGNGSHEHAAGAAVVGWVFVLFALAWILCGLSYAACMAVAGSFLKHRRHHKYCVIIACISCAFMPFGTVLGVFTILVLMRPSVKAAFGLSR